MYELQRLLSLCQVMELPAYQEWSAQFGPDTQHIYVNSKATRAATIMTSSAVIQARLNCLDESVFPLHKRNSHLTNREAGLSESICYVYLCFLNVHPHI